VTVVSRTVSSVERRAEMEMEMAQDLGSKVEGAVRASRATKDRYFFHQVLMAPVCLSLLLGGFRNLENFENFPSFPTFHFFTFSQCLSSFSTFLHRKQQRRAPARASHPARAELWPRNRSAPNFAAHSAAR